MLEEGGRMVDVEYARGFTDALEYVFKIHNKLNHENKLPQECKNCRLTREISKLQSFAKDKQFEKIEKELGYYLP